MLLPQTRKNLLQLFFQHPTQEFHLREISRKTKVVPQNVSKYAKEYVDNGLLLRREIGNLTLYRINPDSAYLFKLFEIFEIERKEKFMSQNKNISRLIREYTENLVRLSNRDIQMILLFGSVARGSWSKESDIDILTLTSDERNKKRTLAVQDEADQKFNHVLEISAINTTTVKFTEGIRVGLEFYNELWRDRIVLYNEYLFWQLMKQAKLKHETTLGSDTI